VSEIPGLKLFRVNAVSESTAKTCEQTVSNATEILDPAQVGGRAGEPAVWIVALIFWTAFAAAVVFVRITNPAVFAGQDPDSLLRLVQVRDLMAGQDWFDLVQHRLDPPDGSLLHWSRVVDLPIVALMLLGNLFGNGEAFVLTAWPLLLFLGMMTGTAYVATALGGRAAAVPALALSLVFIDPLYSFLPNRIDHHNAQLVLLIAALAAALRLERHPFFGLAAGVLSALMLAIGLEMIPYVAVIGAVVAIRWAMIGAATIGTGAFGAAFGIGTPVLYLLTGSPAAPAACDALSWSFAVPAALAGCGLAALTRLAGSRGSAGLRLGALGVLAAASAAALLVIAPECLNGPYGAVSAELKAAWLNKVTEAQPIFVYFARDPSVTIASAAPPAIALAVATWRMRRGNAGECVRWSLPALLLAAALALSCYQVRTLPYANAVAIPMLAAWIAGLAAEHRIAARKPAWRAGPVIAAVLLSLPLAHLAVAWAGTKAVAIASDGRIAPREQPEAPAHLVEGLSVAEKECLDASSAALFAQVPKGVVLAPLFYGPGLLAISEHQVVAGPYHRSGEAILDTLNAFRGPPEAVRPIFRAHGVDYVAVCATARESAITADEMRGGLLAHLIAGGAVSWLEPVPARAPTALRLWRVLD
jgi:hypothetical protein